MFVADYQTRGRGRHGRTWLCPPFAGLMSVLLRRRDAPAYTYTMPAAVALFESIERLLALQPTIKWPNDVVVDGRKVAGVLAEASDDGREQTIVVGVGVNVNLDEAELAELRTRDLALDRGRVLVHRGELLALMLERFDSWLGGDRFTREEGLWRAWNGRLWGRDQRCASRRGKNWRRPFLAASATERCSCDWTTAPCDA